MVRRYTGAPHLHVHTKRVWVEQADGTEIDLMDVCLKRSKLLRNICDTVVPPWEAQLEIDAAGLQQWILHVQPGPHLLSKPARRFSNTTLASFRS